MDAEIQDPNAETMPQTDSNDESAFDASETAAVTLWLERIARAKRHWNKDFERMTSNMDFTAGIQWQGQDSINFGKYVANITLQVVNQKEASLYAKNPTVVAKRRPRMDFQIWDERNETLMQAAQTVQMASQAQQMGNPTVSLMPQVQQASMLMLDYQNGMKIREQMDRVGKTLEIMYKYFCDSMSPDFKEQMKGLVRRTVICNVGYVRQEFIREYDHMVPTGTPDNIKDTMQRGQMLMKQFSDGEFGEDDAKYNELQQVMGAIQAHMMADSQLTPRSFIEKLIFLFPKSRSIIPDEKCSDFVGFINADWVCEEHNWRLSYVNEYFEKNIQAGGDVKENETTEMVQVNKEMPGKSLLGSNKDPEVCVYEVYSKATRSKFWLCKGYKGYLQEPEAVQPVTRHFWPWFALVFNKVECDSSTKTTAIGPSDVQQMKHPQQEWNRTREELREHRKANAPQMFYREGLLGEEDKKRLKGAPTGAWVGLTGMVPGEDIKSSLMAKPIVELDPLVYDATPLMQDVQMTTGQQEANIGGRQGGKKGETATAAAIAEQSRVAKSSSNVDDLDNLLTRLAQNGGELMFYEVQPETVKRICGQGGVFPTTPDSRKEFAECIYLEVEAASSGRPNQQLEISNAERLAPFLMPFAQANPAFGQVLLREMVKRLGDDIDISEIPPIPLQNVPPQTPLPGDQQQGQPGQPQGQMQQAPGANGQQGVQQGAPPQHTPGGVQRQ